MKPPVFDYKKARSEAEALDLLKENEDAKVLAGGQSLIPLLNMRLARPTLLVDVMGLTALSGVADDGETLRIGALTRHKDLERDPVIASRMPFLAEAATLIGHEAIRTRGTLGGSVVHADPAAEFPLVLHTLGAELHLVKSGSERWVPVEDFFYGFMMTAILPDELLEEVRFPARQPGDGFAIREFARRSGDFALAAAACHIHWGPGGRPDSVRLSLGGVGPGPVRAQTAEEAILAGAGEGDLVEVSRLIHKEIDPGDDVHATRAFRAHLAHTLAADALKAAWSQARQSGEVS